MALNRPRCSVEMVEINVNILKEKIKKYFLEEINV